MDLYDKLACENPWIARLLGLDKWVKKARGTSDIIREYEKDKWSKIFASVSSVKSDDVYQEILKLCGIDKSLTIGYRNGRLLSDSRESFFQDQIGSLQYEIESSINNKISLIELGAGTGIVINKLAELNKNKIDKYYALEISHSGREICKLVNNSIGNSVKALDCNFFDNSYPKNLPKNAIWFSCFSLCCFSKIKPSFFINIIEKFKPNKFIFLEPIYEHKDCLTLLSCLQKSYLKKNRYCINFENSILKLESSGLVDKCKIIRNISGINPFLPYSIISVVAT